MAENEENNKIGELKQITKKKKKVIIYLEVEINQLIFLDKIIYKMPITNKIKIPAVFLETALVL